MEQELFNFQKPLLLKLQQNIYTQMTYMQNIAQAQADFVDQISNYQQFQQTLKKIDFDFDVQNVLMLKKYIENQTKQVNYQQKQLDSIDNKLNSIIQQKLVDLDDTLGQFIGEE